MSTFVFIIRVFPYSFQVVISLVVAFFAVFVSRVIVEVALRVKFAMPVDMVDEATIVLVEPLPPLPLIVTVQDPLPRVKVLPE